ncbi:MAG: phosphotransferase [Mycobacterium sp.]|nr:phosphotransferase [Mycobacterium sp.]
MDYVDRVTSSSTVIRQPSELTTSWLTAALGTGPVTDFAVERIGTGQMSECYRVVPTYADGATGPTSVVLKVAAADPNSRQTGLAMGLYEREVRFYTDVVPALVDPPVAPCLAAAYEAESGAFHLLLGDAAPAAVGDEIRGATVDQAALALTELGRMHRALLGSAELAGASWLRRDNPLNQALMGALYSGFLERYADRIAPAHRELCDRLIGAFDAYLVMAGAEDQPYGLVHGDYRLDNMLFGVEGTGGAALTVVDWQTITWGPVLADVAYFLGCALAPDVRRGHCEALLHAYHDGLGPALSLDEIRDGVRRQAFFGVIMAIASSVLVERTERGDEMFITMLHRHCEHVLDTDALALLPAPSAPEPLQPRESDEDIHPAEADRFWNESWYLDFADPAQQIGGWVRLGLVPNQDRCWINALLCGPDMPTVALLDWHAPIPADHTRVTGAGVSMTLTPTDPLHTFQVTVSGDGLAYDDPSALLHDGAGQPVPVHMDLTWHTDGTPYQYRITNRYEIPCRVSGTVTVGGRSYDFNAVAGQRDHSWAPRDWWSMEWMWCAVHLDGGTHLHGVEMRIPGMGPLGIGYRQDPGRPLVELQSVLARETFGGNDLPTSAQLTLGDVTATVTICGQAPVRLAAEDGRISHFPRLWGTVQTEDGRSGSCWVEWNRNQ